MNYHRTPDNTSSEVEPTPREMLTPLEKLEAKAVKLRREATNSRAFAIFSFAGAAIMSGAAIYNAFKGYPIETTFEGVAATLILGIGATNLNAASGINQEVASMSGVIEQHKLSVELQESGIPTEAPLEETA